jgi:hypothetical protein
MNPLELVIAIIAITFLYKLVDTWIRHNSGRRVQAAENETLKRLGEVEERVRVLERIVTDERFDLKREFKNLGG